MAKYKVRFYIEYDIKAKSDFDACKKAEKFFREALKSGIYSFDEMFSNYTEKID